MLTADQITTFHTDGYLVVPDVIPPGVIAGIQDEYAGLIDTLYDRWHRDGLVPAPSDLSFWDKLQLSYDARLDWFQPMDISLPGGEIAHNTPMHFGPNIFDLVINACLLDCVEALIGPEITSNPIQHVRIKPPAKTLDPNEPRPHVTSTDWHQDRGVNLAEADHTHMVTAWVAITDATIENGCLQVVPGIEKGLLPHCPQKQTSIAPGHLRTQDAVPLPVPSGGVILFHPLVPHGSLDNCSDGFRWSFDLRYNITGENTGREHFPSFVARSKSAPNTELHDWRIWKNQWEAARARLSTAPHIPIHRWASDAPYCA